MRPPICAICDDDFDPSGPDETSGGSITFREGPDHTPLPDGMDGHPENVEWFCARHWAAAKALESFTLSEAMERLAGDSASP